jgi:DNA polymerase-3 subunit delta
VKGHGGEQVDTSPGRKIAAWADEQLRSAGLQVDREGTDRLVAWLGDDPQRLVGLVATLVGAFGEGTRLGVEEIEPFLGEGGGVPPWELTDALDRGDIATALAKLRRMLDGGGRHPLVVMATLHGHYARMLQLDGAPVSGERDAAQLLGLRGSTYPARKAMQQARRLGHDRIVDAISLLAAADLDLRGAKAWPEDLVLEVLVARLARLAR